MADILKSLHEQYVPVKDGEVMHTTVLHGDQLTEERARNVQWTYKNGETEEERLQGLEPTFSEFHLKMCLLEVKWWVVICLAQITTNYLLIPLIIYCGILLILKNAYAQLKAFSHIHTISKPGSNSLQLYVEPMLMV